MPAVYFNDYVLDNGLAVLVADADEIHLCDSVPADFTEATTTKSLANYPAVPNAIAAYSGGPGRQVEFDADAAVVPTASGTCTHYAVVDTVNSRLLGVNTCTPNQALVISVSVGVPAFAMFIEK